MEFRGFHAFSEKYRELAAQELTDENTVFIAFSDNLLTAMAYASNDSVQGMETF